MSQSGEIRVLTGKPAHSLFGLQKVCARVPEMVYAEHVHILYTDAPMTAEQVAQAELLLNYGPNRNIPARTGEAFVTVLPRQGTISPWSSKATDIFHICGLSKVQRVERGVRWYRAAGAEPADLTGVYDRMTERLVFGEDFSDVFSELAPQPLVTVPLQAQGGEAPVR